MLEISDTNHHNLKENVKEIDREKETRHKKMILLLENERLDLQQSEYANKLR